MTGRSASRPAHTASVLGVESASVRTRSLSRGVVACALLSLTAPALAERPRLRAGERLAAGGWRESAVEASRLEVDAAWLAGRPVAIDVELSDGETVSAVRRRFERRGPDSFLWHGRVRGGGEMLVTAVAGRLAGVVWAGDRQLEIVPLPGGGQALLTIDPARLAGCGLVGSAPAASSSGFGAAAGDAVVETGAVETGAVETAPRGSPIDVMVLYDAATRDRLGGRAAVEAVIQNNVDLTNAAYRNSRIRPRLRLVHSQLLAPPGPPRSHDDNRAWLRSDPEVRRLRDRHGADLVGLLFGRDLGFCGTAAMIYGRGGGERDAVFDVYLGCGVSSLTFAHEVGHLQGADHDPDNASGGAPVAGYAFGHLHDGLYRTVMAYSSSCLGGCPSQPFFSNPAVSYRGRRTGVAGERDNARRLEETAGEVAAFRAPAAGCTLAPGHPDFCRDCGPCAEREGDCDGDAECAADLLCAVDAGEEFGFDAATDVCLRRGAACPLPRGHPDRCRVCGPCGFGDGDCDGDDDCQSGLSCLDDAGADFGLPATTDVCGHRSGGFCPYPLGHPDYCRACGPCRHGEGNCVDRSDCALPILSRCAEDVGAQFGLAPDVDVCVLGQPGCVASLGEADYCRACGQCDVGEGDCDADRECRGELVCVDGAGAEFGLPGADVCLPPDRERRLPAPSQLRGAAVSPQAVRLRWQDNSADEDGFVVEMRIDATKFEGVARVTANVRTVVVAGLRPDTAYTFRVAARGPAGRSDYSNELVVRTPPRAEPPG